MNYGVTQTGFVRPTYDELLADVKNDIRAQLPDADITSTSPLGQLAQVIARRMLTLWAALEQTYDAAYIDSAEAVNLDKLAALSGMRRNSATYAQGEVVFFRATAAPLEYTIPAGVTVATADRSITYVTLETGTIAAGFSSSNPIPIRATQPGIKYNLAANQIKSISTPVLGVDSVENPQPITGGSDKETDAVFRARMKTYQPQIRGTPAAMRSALYAINGVLGVNLVEDFTANSAAVYIQGGDDTAITAAIEEVRPVGIEVTWSRPPQKTMDVTTEVFAISSTNTDILIAAVKETITQLIQTWPIGTSLDYSAIVSAILSVPDVRGLSSLQISSGDQTISGFGQSIMLDPSECAAVGTISVLVAE
ncbi:MAG TPA: baseplate J/gp47 family protein [Methanocorpusculum sp.]|nr:baseplate J/gp47 family protein [Methanocorpusculum sp.]